MTTQTKDGPAQRRSHDGYGLLLLGQGNGPSACEGSTQLVVTGGDPYALVALEAIKYAGRTRLIITSDQDNAVKNLVDLIRDSRTHETAVINTRKGIERANYEV